MRRTTSFTLAFTVAFTPLLHAIPAPAHTDDMEHAPPAPLDAPAVAEEAARACDETAPCEPGPLLAAFLQLERAMLITDETERDISLVAAIHTIGALHDTRAIPLLVRLSTSDNLPIRLAALSSLGGLSDDARALARLRQSLVAAQRPEEIAVALPALAGWAARHPGEQAVPCPEEGACVEDDVLLHALLRYTESRSMKERAQRVTAIGALGDARSVAQLLRLSADVDEGVRAAALGGLGRHAEQRDARRRILDLMSSGTQSDRLAAIHALATVQDGAIGAEMLARRREESDPQVKAALDVELTRRAPQQLAALQEEERLAALEAENAPGAFDTTMRALLTGATGTAAAVGGAASSALVADQVAQGTGFCFGAWGACAGGASAAAITWFALGDRKLGGADVALAVSTGVAGGFAGLLIPPTIGDVATQDGRHMIYAAAGGALLGVAGGTVGALLTKPKLEDVAELDLTILGANLLTSGALLSFGSGNDARPLFGALIGATLVGAGGGGVAAHFLTLDAAALGHTALLSTLGLGAGLFAGGAREAFARELNGAHVAGAGLLGAGLGIATGLTLGELDLVPNAPGMFYETWAATTYGAAGAGAGVLVGTLMDRELELGLTGAAAGAVIGAASTALFPEGVTQDYGDLLLQPLFIGFGLYHGGLLVGLATLDPGPTTAAALLTPALASLGLAYAAPHIRAGAGDVLMIASMMGFSAYLSSMGMLSVTLRDGDLIPAWGYVLGTALAMDLGIAAGVTLDLLDFEHLGWRVTYVAAVAAGTTLVASLPGALFAVQEGSPVKVSDVLLASSLVGAAIGLGTMPLIDFRIAPDFGLGNRPGDGADVSTALGLELQPTVLALAPLRDEEPTMALGLAGKF
jgi:HEAT repeat protein